MEEFHLSLKHNYERIDSMNQRPTSQDELNAPLTYCRAVWSMGTWKHTSVFFELQKQLECCKESAVLFSDSVDNADTGRLHFSLFQLQTFPQDPSILSSEQHDRDSTAIQRILSIYPSFTVHFTGITRTKYGLFLNGYPTIHLNSIRDQIRHTLSDLHEPHAQDICHATLLRFRKPPSEAILQHLDHLIQTYHDALLTTMIPATWEYGYGTWLQRDTERRVMREWKSHPRWILHRGLTHGPNRSLENNENEILSRIQEGWDIEMDVWYIDGSWWIGHDAPTTPLEHTELLTHKQCWIHCKNVEALYHIPKESHHFVHDRDVATLTSDRYIWYNINQFVYPEVGSDKGSVIVLPERSDFSRETIWKATAVCSDYLPLHFL
jgi:hypothetical protein